MNRGGGQGYEAGRGEGEERGGGECRVPARWAGDPGTLCSLLDPREMGGFCIYVPAWVGPGARDLEGVLLQADCHGGQDGQAGGYCLVCSKSLRSRADCLDYLVLCSLGQSARGPQVT